MCPDQPAPRSEVVEPDMWSSFVGRSSGRNRSLRRALNAEYSGSNGPGRDRIGLPSRYEPQWEAVCIGIGGPIFGRSTAVINPAARWIFLDIRRDHVEMSPVIRRISGYLCPCVRRSCTRYLPVGERRVPSGVPWIVRFQTLQTRSARSATVRRIVSACVSRSKAFAVPREIMVPLMERDTSNAVLDRTLFSLTDSY